MKSTLLLYFLLALNVMLWLPPAIPAGRPLGASPVISQGRGDMWARANESNRLQCLNGALETYNVYFPVTDDKVAAKAAEKYYFKCLMANKVII